MAAMMLCTAAPKVGIPVGSCSSIVGSPFRLPARSAAPLLRRKSRPIVRAAAPVPLPAEYGYVVLTAASSYVLTQWQAIQVALQRRKLGIKYPKMYEEAEESVFNCYQRAHQNTLEAYPAYLALLLTGGLAYPITSAALGLIWVIGRIVYSLGYYTGKPENRNKGAWHFFALPRRISEGIPVNYCT
ncbi:hypothetical protein R1flu_001293 [Riccia fluitans]|uniref:Glutathione S-transferase 3, mitochondrial n=1 Tax=Riccia fluitans TaxID=41844 RepID=A0ABD1Y2V7_9MARC